MQAYLFDVDGVLTNMQTRKITNPEVMSLLVGVLQKGAPLGFISGRGLLWMRSHLIKLIEEYVDKHPMIDKKVLDNVYVSGEFGGVTCIHVNGERQESVNHDFTIPDDVKRGLHLVAFQYSEYIYIETEKQTIFTAVGNPGIKEEDFQARKQAIIDEFKEVIKPYPDLEVQSDRLSINIRHLNANKSNATDMFISWLKEKRLTIEKYFVFGDSLSDLEMGEELHKQQLPFAFIYVGEQEDLSQAHPSFQLTVTKGHCDEGTVEYLKAQEQ